MSRRSATVRAQRLSSFDEYTSEMFAVPHRHTLAWCCPEHGIVSNVNLANRRLSSHMLYDVPGPFIAYSRIVPEHTRRTDRFAADSTSGAILHRVERLTILAYACHAHPLYFLYDDVTSRKLTRGGHETYYNPDAQTVYHISDAQRTILRDGMKSYLAQRMQCMALFDLWITGKRSAEPTVRKRRG